MRALFELVTGLILLMVSFVSSAVTRPGVGLAVFPTEGIEQLCAVSTVFYGSFPADGLPDLILELQALDSRGLEARICGADTREEVSYGLAVLGASQLEHGEGEAMLRVAADQLVNPLAMASRGRAAYRAGDYAEASRYLEAAFVVAEEVGVEAAVHAVGRRTYDRLGGRKVRELFDRDLDRPSTERFAHRRLVLHRAIYGVPARGEGN